MVTTSISGAVINIAEPNAAYKWNSNNNEHLKINIIWTKHKNSRNPTLIQNLLENAVVIHITEDCRLQRKDQFRYAYNGHFKYINFYTYYTIHHICHIRHMRALIMSHYFLHLRWYCSDLLPWKWRASWSQCWGWQWRRSSQPQASKQLSGAPPHKVELSGLTRSTQSRSEGKGPFASYLNYGFTNLWLHYELEGNDRGGAKVGEDVAVGEEDGGVVLEDQLAKHHRGKRAPEEAGDVEEEPGVHQEVGGWLKTGGCLSILADWG